MWNERQWAQGVEIEIARIKREMAEQDRALEGLMADHYVSHAELDALDMLDEAAPDSRAGGLGEVLAQVAANVVAATETAAGPLTPAHPRPRQAFSFADRFVLRG